jgi:mannose-6-phosphate isomerase-like protein (cupin superfamily)
VSGEAEIRYPERNRTVNLSAGNFILNERDKPHVVSNSVKEEVLLYACCAEKKMVIGTWRQT